MASPKASSIDFRLHRRAKCTDYWKRNNLTNSEKRGENEPFMVLELKHTVFAGDILRENIRFVVQSIFLAWQLNLFLLDSRSRKYNKGANWWAVASPHTHFELLLSDAHTTRATHTSILNESIYNSHSNISLLLPALSPKNFPFIWFLVTPQNSGVTILTKQKLRMTPWKMTSIQIKYALLQLPCHALSNNKTNNVLCVGFSHYTHTCIP